MFVIPRAGESGPAEVIDCDPDPIPRRRRKSQMPPALVIGSVFLLGAITVTVVVIALMRNSGTADKPKESAKKESVKAGRVDRHVPAREERIADREVSEESGDNPITEVPRKIMGVVFGLVGLAFYLAPTAVAVVRKHNNIAPIFIVNFLLGWICVGWVIALSWAFTDLKQLQDQRRSWL